MHAASPTNGPFAVLCNDQLIMLLSPRALQVNVANTLVLAIQEAPTDLPAPLSFSSCSPVILQSFSNHFQPPNIYSMLSCGMSQLPKWDSKAAAGQKLSYCTRNVTSDGLVLSCRSINNHRTHLCLRSMSFQSQWVSCTF